jgi:T4 RnlA family RNA ligase
MNYLVTYEDALEMCKVYKDFNFSKTEYMFGDYKVVSFGYFLCDYKHFTKPLSRKPEVNALDMRGVTFVFDKDGKLWKRFLMLRKFFNLDQVESTQYGVVKDKKIKSVHVKEDGSLIAFMGLPNGTIFAKTIGSFDNDQTNAAMKILNEKVGLFNFVKYFIEKDCTPLFEYVSWDNRIVLKYSKPELRFLGMRNNKTGEFLQGSGFTMPEDSLMSFAQPIIVDSLDELIEMSKIEKEKEGWVVEFEDGQFMKIKTEWYFNLHGIRTMNIFREDYVIKNYLEEKLDDVIGQLDKEEDADAFKFVDRVINAVDNYLVAVEEGVKKLVKVYEDEYKSTWHYFAKFNNKEAFFGLAVVAIQQPNNYHKRKIEFIINKTKHLKKAQSFVDKWTKVKDDAISPWRK